MTEPMLKAARRRDAAIDTIRGICIVTMTFSHLSEGTIADKISHPAPWVDGASGFVLMSGLVLGMVQPGRIARSGLIGAEIKLLKRAGLLYIAHVLTVLLALIAGHFAPAVKWFPRTQDHGGLLRTLADILLLQVNPPDIDILSLYVILLLFAAGATALLAIRRTWIVGMVSAALYVIASLYPSAFTLPTGNGQLSKFNWGAWQILFLSALIVGWYWKEKNLRAVLNSRKTFIIGALVWAGVTLGGVAFARLGVIPALKPTAYDWYYNKSDLGFARLVISWSAFVTLYGLLTALLKRLNLSWLAPIESIGRRSLASFIVLTVITVMVPVIAGHPVTGPVSMLVSAVSLLVIYGYVVVRYGIGDRGAFLRPKKVPQEVS